MKDRPSDPRGFERFVRRNGLSLLTTILIVAFAVGLTLFTDWTTTFLSEYGKTVGQCVAGLYLLMLALIYTPVLFRYLRKRVEKMRERHIAQKLRQRWSLKKEQDEDETDVTDHFRGMGGRRSLAMLIAAGGLSVATVYLTHFTSEEAWMFNDTAIQTAKAVLVCFIWLPLLNWTLLYEYDLWNELVTKRNGALGRFVLGLCVILALIYG